MATVYAQANGNASAINWNTAANGSGDTVTWANIAAADTADANGYTVELDVGATGKTLALLTNTTGGYTCNLSAGGDRTITCDVTAVGAVCITTSGATYLLTLNGSATGGAATGSHAVKADAASSVTITGDSTGGSSTGYGAYNNSTGTIIIGGDSTGGSANDSRGSYNASTGTLTIQGGAYGSSSSGTVGTRNQSTGTLNVNGDVQGGSGTNAHGIYNNGAGIVNIGGTLAGGTSVSANGVNNGSSSATITMSGIIDFSSAGSPVGGFTSAMRYAPSEGKYCKFSTSTGTVNCPQQLTAAEVKKNVVHGTVTGTYKPWQVKGVDF